MELTNSEHALLMAAARSRRETRELSRRFERNKRSEQQRRSRAIEFASRDRFDNGHPARRLLGSIGLEENEIERYLTRQAEQRMALLEAQRRMIVAQSGAVAQRHASVVRQREAGLASYRPLGIHDQLAFKSFITLDTAATIEATPFSDPIFQFDVSADPPASGHNFVKAFALQQTSVQYGFHIPGLPIPVDIDYLFAFRADSDIALNAITFVQPNGLYALQAIWQPFANSSSSLDFTAGLDVHILYPNGGVYTDNGTRDDRLSQSLDVGMWDLFQDSLIVGDYSDQSTLFDNNYVAASAGSVVVFDVWVALTMWSDGNANAELDFQSGDFGINVPAVYVSTFEFQPIP
jgi:hypothetical protein